MKTVVDWQNPEDLNRLLTMSRQELQEYYPQLSWESLRRTKNKYKSKLGKVRAMEQAGQEPTEAQKRLVRTWEVARGNADDEWDVITLHAYDHTPELNETFEPVEPAKITPTRKKRIQRLAKYILAYGDGQVDYRRIINPVTDEMELVPLHNVPMHNILKQFNARYRPETTVNLGDFADMAALSRFDPDSDHFHKTLAPSMRYIHDFYAQLVADNPDAHHVEVDSNHATRLKKQTLRNMPAMHDFVRPGEEYPMMTYYFLANLGKLGIDFVSGYGNAEFLYGEQYARPPILFKHGTHSSSNPGATVRKEALENPDVNVVRGHGHSDQEIRVTRRNGEVLFYKQLGSSCLNTAPVPGYHSAVDDHNQPVKYHNQKHQNTFALIEDFGNGRYNLNTITVVDGVTYFNGEIFDGNTE